MMKVLLISVNKEKAVRPVLPIGMVTVAAQAIKAGFDVDCLDLCFESDDEAAVKTKIKSHDPRVIGLSVRNVDSQSFIDPVFYSPFVLQVVAWCREQKPQAIIVLGGAGFSQVPEELLRYTGADYGIVGLSEESFPLFLNKIRQQESVDDVPGLMSLRTDGQTQHTAPMFEIDFDRAAPPARQFYDQRYFQFGYQSQNAFEKVVEPVQSKKGCSLNCIFCTNFAVEGTKITLKSTSQTIDEVERIIEQSDTKGFEFVDGVFNIPLQHALNVCREMLNRKIKVPWTCMLNAGAVTEELADLMAQTGCRLIDFGTDSCSEPILKILKKNFTKKQIIQSHRIMEKVGIEIMHCVFIGNPGDTRETVMETLDVLEELVPDKEKSTNHVYISLGLRIGKGTELHRIAIQEGVLKQDDDMGVPRFYVSPLVLNDEELLDDIEKRIVNNKNWYLWWGIPPFKLKERIQHVLKQNNKVERLYLDRMSRNKEYQLGCNQ